MKPTKLRGNFIVTIPRQGNRIYKKVLVPGHVSLHSTSLLPEVIQWLNENVGEEAHSVVRLIVDPTKDWCEATNFVDKTIHAFNFVDKQKAALFKLTWG